MFFTLAAICFHCVNFCWFIGRLNSGFDSSKIVLWAWRMVFLPSACFRHSNPSDRCAAFVFVCNERCSQPRCVILWVPCFSIKEESGFFFWIAWERLPLNHTDSCLTPRRNNKQDCHLTEGMLILQLLYMKVWLLLLKEDTCADFSTWPLYMPAADIRRDDCRAQAAFHGAASSVALMSMLS